MMSKLNTPKHRANTIQQGPGEIPAERHILAAQTEPTAYLLHQIQEQEQLPEAWLHDALQCFVPLCDALAAQQRRSPGKCLCIGISGAQGTGKSTLARALAALFETCHGLHTAALSIDDFYLTREHRQVLAGNIHPLLQTRGAPGTHDIPLALETLSALKSGSAHIQLPAFDKASDNRTDPSNWQDSGAALDVLILEGWCVGLPPETFHALTRPVNLLESHEDSDGAWRHYCNQALAGPYQQLFALLDKLVMLKAPSFTAIYNWRALQEQKLARHLHKHKKAVMENRPRIMSEEEIYRFIQHYERLTRHALKVLPATADYLFELDEQHRIHCGPVTPDTETRP